VVDIWRLGLRLLLSWLLGTFKPQGLPERIKSLTLACGVVARLGWVNARKFPPFSEDLLSTNVEFNKRIDLVLYQAPRTEARCEAMYSFTRGFALT
jgi:hypothetical protein